VKVVDKLSFDFDIVVIVIVIDNDIYFEVMVQQFHQYH